MKTEIRIHCAIAGCSDPIFVKSRGLCRIHYTRWWTHGDPLAYIKGSKAAAHCSIGGCLSKVANVEHQWCLAHYKRWYKHGDPLVTKKAYRVPEHCSVDGCALQPIAKGLCMNHYAINRRWGTPEKRREFVGAYTKDGYRYVWDGHRHYEPEHRILMTRMLGRKLKQSEHVHHIDGDTLNNSPNNLQLLTRGEHTALHIKDRRRGPRGRLI